MQTRLEGLRAHFGGKCGVVPRDDQRLRDYLTRREVAALLRAAKKSPQNGLRNYATSSTPLPEQHSRRGVAAVDTLTSPA